MQKKIPFLTYLFFILVYGCQGFSDLPGQSLYYLTRETWNLSATMLGVLAFITSLAWMVKPIFGYLSDYLETKGKLKSYLLINTFLIMSVCGYVVVFGFNIWSLILCLFLMNCAIAGNDVANDKVMCELEQKHNLQGKIQSVQWTALGVAGLVVALLGAWIAKVFPNTINYRIAFGIVALVPIVLYIYINNHMKDSSKQENKLKFSWSILKNKEFLLGALFIIFLRFSPSFGTALTIRMREVMGVDKMFLGYLGATGTVLGIGGYLLYYWKAHKFPLKKLLYFAILFSALTNLCYLYIPNKYYILTYNILFGVFDGVGFLAIMAFIAQIVPKGYEGVSYAVITSLNNLSGRLGGVLGGFLYDNFGYNFNVITASVTTLMCLALVPFLIIKEKEA